MTLEVLDALLSLWYQRQEDPDIATTFQFRQYPDKEGATHAAIPQKLLPTKTQATNPAPSRIVPPKRDLKKEKNRKEKKRVRVRATKRSESEGEKFPSLSEADSATSDGGELGLFGKEREIPKLSKKIKPRPILKKIKRIGSNDEEVGTKLEHLDPELQTIHDNIVAKAETKKKKTLEGTSIGKRLEGVGADEDELPQKPYRFGPVSRGGAGRDFVGIISHPLSRVSLKDSEVSLTNGLSRKHRREEIQHPPVQKRSRDEADSGLATSPPKKVKKNPAHATQGEGKSLLKKSLSILGSDRQTRASSQAKRIQTRSKGRTK